MAVGYWFEVWRRPGHAQFGRLIDDPPFEFASFHIGVGLVGDGGMTLPDNYERINEILRVAGVNSTSSLVRIREDATGTVVGEWLPSSIAPTATKDASTVEVAGNGINEILDYAVTEAFDWDGTVDWVCSSCDWLWGSANLLTNPDFENNAIVFKSFDLVVRAASGTYTLFDGRNPLDATAAIAFNATASTIETRIQTDLDLFADVVVVQTDTSPTTFRIQMVDPPYGLNLGVNTGSLVGSIYLLTIDATGGTYRLSDGVNQTSDINHNASAATIETRLQVDIASINDVAVTDIGNNEEGNRQFDIRYVNPTTGSLTVNPASLTGGGASLVPRPLATTTAVDEGGQTPSGWTPAQTLIGLSVKGTYDQFVFSDNRNHTPGGTYSLAIDPGVPGTTSNRNLGAQQVVNVTSGALYQAGVWVYPLGSLDRYRLGLFTRGEEVIAWTSVLGQTLTPNTWNLLSLSDVVIPDGVDQVIFRIVNTNLAPFSPTVFYIDDAYFYEGLPPSTVGDIVGLLYDHATDTTLRNPIVWENEANPGTPYLTLDFSDTVDSAGAAWANPEVAIRIWMRMSFLQALEALEDQETIEWRVVPNNVEAGTWKLQIYNEGGMDTAPAVAILGGADDTRRLVRAYRPRTQFLVEGAERVTYRASSATLTAAFGRIETATLNRTVTDARGAQAQALASASTAETAGLVWSYELTNPQDAPLLDFRLGDTLGVHDPPVADGEARVWEMNVTFSKEATVWDVDLLVEEEV